MKNIFKKYFGSQKISTVGIMTDDMNEVTLQDKPKDESHYKNRLKEDALKLSEKLNILDLFISSSKFNTLRSSERLDLKTQRKHMHNYLTVLNRRIYRIEHN